MNETVKNGLKNGFHDFLKMPNISQFAMFLLWISTMVFGLGGLRADLRTAINDQAKMEKAAIVEQAKMDAKIELINSAGTNYSRQNLALDHAIIIDQQARMIKVEDAITSIAVMKEKIERISEDVKGIRADGGHDKK